MTTEIRAAVWMIGAIIGFTSMAIAGRAVSPVLDTFEIMLYRSAVGFVIVTACLFATGQTTAFRTKRSGLHLLRNLAHFAGQNFWFFSLPLIPLAQLFALEFTTPIWAVLLAPLILKERITATQIIVLALGVVGVLIVARPTAEGIANIGFMTAAFCAICFAFAALFTRRLTRTETIGTILFYLTFYQLIFGLVCAGYDGDVTLPTGATLPWVILISVAGLSAHFCLTQALASAPAGFVMPFDFARLPIVVLIGAAFYGEAVDLWVILGALVIFAANALNIRAERASPLHSPQRNN